MKVILEAASILIFKRRRGLRDAELAVLHDLRDLEDWIREQRALPDLDPELTLQTEHDVQEVDGLRTRIAL